MRVYEAVANAFVAEGTSAVFGIVGDANQHWLDALSSRGVAFYEARHEGSALSMAEGWARVQGAPGICTTTSGPGVTQLATAMVVASRAHTPLVAFCGDTPVGNASHNQNFNEQRFAEAIECGFVRVARAESAYESVQRAFYQARTASRPVILSASTDVQQELFNDDDTYRTSQTLMSPGLIHPDPERIAAAVELIAASARPVIIAGIGAKRSGAADAILSLAAQTGALLTTSLLAANWLRDRYEYHGGISGNFSTKVATSLLQEADCVIAVGASLNSYTTEHGLLYPGAQFIQIDLAPSLVMGDGRVADCYIQSDARLGVEALSAALDERSARINGYHSVEVKERLSRALQDPTHYELNPGTVDPREVCRVLDALLPPDIGWVFGSGHQSNFDLMLFTRPRSIALTNKSFNCIGQGLSTAVGAAIATDRTPLLLMEGDVGFMMHLAEFETAVRYSLPLLAVVMNDQGAGTERLKAELRGLNADIALASTPDLGQVGVALGGTGALVTSVEGLREATAAFVESPRPTILDVRISPNVVCVQYRRLWHGEDV